MKNKSDIEKLPAYMRYDNLEYIDNIVKEEIKKYILTLTDEEPLDDRFEKWEDD